MKTFLTNQHGYYFILESQIDFSKLKNAIVHNSFEEMQDWVVKNQNLTERDECSIEYAVYLKRHISIKKDIWVETYDQGKGEIWYSDQADCINCIEDYINEFEL